MSGESAAALWRVVKAIPAHLTGLGAAATQGNRDLALARLDAVIALLQDARARVEDHGNG